MEKNRIRKLRQYYHSLLGHQKIFEEAGISISQPAVTVLSAMMNRIEGEFPNLVPKLNSREFVSHSGSEMGDGYFQFYNVAGLRSYIAMVLGILKIEIDADEGDPVFEMKDFSFIIDSTLKKCIERDYSEIQRAYVARCWKSVIILAGGTIEAILTDLLAQNVDRAINSSKAPKQKDITRWDLSDLINVSVDLNIVTSGVEKLSHAVRDYRNLVHPGNEIRTKLSFDAEEARIAIEVLHMVHRDLS